MTGTFPRISDYKKARIKQLTEEGLSAKVIATRMGLSSQAIYQYQTTHGLREVKNPRKRRR